VFTGIIEEVGVIQELRLMSEGAMLTVGAQKIIPGMKAGDSIAINGVCLTATRIGSGSFICDISAETLQRSNLKNAKVGVRINLERALMVGARLGGHYVLGHVDDVGKLIAKSSVGEGYDLSFDFPSHLERYLVYKGSISVNGISLTISALEKASFSVSVIPHTFQETNLNQMTIGDLVNLEVDILGKYFERFFQLGPPHNSKTESKLTSEYLKSQGF
jgi:riboflavin synthase